MRSQLQLVNIRAIRLNWNSPLFRWHGRTLAMPPELSPAVNSAGRG